MSQLEPLQEIISDKLGHWYMANHGVSAAALIEDMRTVLTAYWRLSSKRLTENICMSFEAHVLQKLSEEIESELLTAVQVGCQHTVFLRTNRRFLPPLSMCTSKSNRSVCSFVPRLTTYSMSRRISWRIGSS